MVVSEMSRDIERPELFPTPDGDFVHDFEEPLDFLVKALSQAVARKQAAKTKETEYRT